MQTQTQTERIPICYEYSNTKDEVSSIGNKIRECQNKTSYKKEEREKEDLREGKRNLARANLLKAWTKILKTAFAVSKDLKKHFERRCNAGI